MLPFDIPGKRAIRIDAFDRRAPEQKDARPVLRNPCGGGDVLDGTAASPAGAGVGFGAVEQERVMHYLDRSTEEKLLKVCDEQLLQGRGGARGEGAGAGRFEEMMLAGLEWD